MTTQSTSKALEAALSEQDGLTPLTEQQAAFIAAFLCRHISEIRMFNHAGQEPKAMDSRLIKFERDFFRCLNKISDAGIKKPIPRYDLFENPVGPNTWVSYEGNKCYVAAVQYTEHLFALLPNNSDPNCSPADLHWVRWENVEILIFNGVRHDH